MGNVQSEATQESETTKDGEEKANLDRRKPERGPSGPKQGAGSRSPGPQTAKPSKDAGQTQGTEPGGGDRQTGATVVGKSHSKKSKLKLCSMWPQNSPSGGIKEGASPCDKEPVLERQGLACLSLADLQADQSTGSVLQEEQKGTKAALRPPQAMASDPRDLGTKRAAARGRTSRAENASLGKDTAGPLQPGKLMELGWETVADEDAAEPKTGWTEHSKASPKQYSDCERQMPESVPCIRKQAESSAQGTAPSNETEDPSAGPKFLSERNTDRPASSSGVASPGGKKALLSWGSGHWEKEQAGQRDSAPGSDGDSKGTLGAGQGGVAVPASTLVAECATTSSGPVEKQALGSDAKAEAQDEAMAAEVVSSETMQELLERGLNFLYKVTIQPGQWPPSIKAMKQKAGLVPSGISYADVLKQCPQKKAPAGPPVLPKAVHHLTAAGKKLPAFKGLERSDSEDISLLSQLFLEHFKKVTPKEPGGNVPSQQAVTFPEELSTTNTKRPEWQRPRPPTPYPQRRRGQGRKLPKFGAAVSQVVAFLGSDSKSDWFVQDESQMSLEEPGMAAEEEGRGLVDLPSGGDKGAEEVGSSPSTAALLMDQDIAVAVEEKVPRSCRRTPGPEEGAKETVSLKSPLCNSTQGIPSMPATAHSFQMENRPPTPLLSPKSHSPSEIPEVSTPTMSAPCVPVGPAPDQKAPAMAQARPKIRKQGPATLKSKEKLKSSGQPKIKASKSKGQKPWTRGCGTTSPLKLEPVPLFPPFEEVARPFYFGEPLVEPATVKEDAAAPEDGPEQDEKDPHPPKHRQWPAFQVADSCSRKCYCKHQHERKLPKTVVAWLNPSTNHLVEPPWVATALLAVSLVAGTKFCMDSYKQQHVAHED